MSDVGEELVSEELMTVLWMASEDKEIDPALDDMRAVKEACERDLIVLFPAGGATRVALTPKGRAVYERERDSVIVIEPGDLVALKCGGPPMVVVVGGTDIVRCMFHRPDTRELLTVNVPRAALMRFGETAMRLGLESELLALPAETRKRMD